EERHTQYVFLKAQWEGEYTEHMIDEVNGLTRKELSIYDDNHEETFLGKINLYDGDSGDLWRYVDPSHSTYEAKDKVYNFGADFAVPVNDPVLVKMIKDRRVAQYTGTQADYPLI